MVLGERGPRYLGRDHQAAPQVRVQRFEVDNLRDKGAARSKEFVHARIQHQVVFRVLRQPQVKRCFAAADSVDGRRDTDWGARHEYRARARKDALGDRPQYFGVGVGLAHRSWSGVGEGPVPSRARGRDCPT